MESPNKTGITPISIEIKPETMANEAKLNFEKVTLVLNRMVPLFNGKPRKDLNIREELWAFIDNIDQKLLLSLIVTRLIGEASEMVTEECF